MNLPVLVVGAVFVGVGLAVAFLGDKGFGGALLGAGLSWIGMWSHNMLLTEAPGDPPSKLPLEQS